MIRTAMATAPVSLSAKALARTRKPRTRGTFLPVDAARRQLGLLSVGDGGGQARLYWLVDLATGTIEDARFLAFGDLTSHAVMDAFTESVRGRTVEDACRLSAEQIEILLRDDPGTPAFADGLTPLSFLRDLQDSAERALPEVRVLPRPADAPAYVRKRKADWSAQDEAWLPLTLFKKAAAVEGIAAEVLRARTEDLGVGYRIDAINDDFRVVIAFSGLPAEQAPTLAKFLEDALRGRLHPQLVVETA
jgi:NifU-like protein involved in Fe-S cluster formation